MFYFLTFFFPFKRFETVCLLWPPLLQARHAMVCLTSGISQSSACKYWQYLNLSQVNDLLLHFPDKLTVDSSAVKHWQSMSRLYHYMSSVVSAMINVNLDPSVQSSPAHRVSCAVLPCHTGTLPSHISQNVDKITDNLLQISCFLLQFLTKIQKKSMTGQKINWKTINSNLHLFIKAVRHRPPDVQVLRQNGNMLQLNQFIFQLTI